ncbi:MAG: hypothetical protein OJJ55_19080 [Rhodococcus sp.]|nr:hypothetical protein [Rhodococcus sp. (in: high G+C Gram-positive bacteria)]
MAGIDFKKASAAALRRTRNPLTGGKLTKSPFAAKPRKGRRGVPAITPGSVDSFNFSGKGKGPLTVKNPLSKKNITQGKKNSKKAKAGGLVGGAVEKAATTRKSVTTSGRGTTASGTGGTTSAAGSTSAAAGGTKQQKPKGAKATGSAASTTTTTTAAAPFDEIGSYYEAAGRQLDRQQQIIDAQRLAKMEDQRVFDEWSAKQRATASDTLKSQFEKSAADAQAARQASLDTIKSYAGEALKQAGGTGILAQSGAQSVSDSYGFLQDATAKQGAQGAFNQAALTERNTAQAEADRARASNLMASYNAAQRAGTDKITEQRGNMALQEIKDRMSKTESDRAYELNKVAADYLNQKNETELGIKQYNAETDRMKVLTNADIQRSALALKEQVAQGTLSYQQAMVQIRKDANKLSGTKADKDRAARMAIAKMKGGSSNDPATAAKYFDSWWKNSGITDVGTGTQARNYARTAIQALRGAYPQLKAGQALSILTGRLGGSVMSDPDIRARVASNFK